MSIVISDSGEIKVIESEEIREREWKHYDELTKESKGKMPSCIITTLRIRLALALTKIEVYENEIRNISLNSVSGKYNSK